MNAFITVTVEVWSEDGVCMTARMNQQHQVELYGLSTVSRVLADLENSIKSVVNEHPSTAPRK